MLKILKNMFKLLKILQMLKLFKIIKLSNLLRRQSAAEPLVPLLVRSLVPVVTVDGNFAPRIKSKGKQITCPE